MHLFNMQIKLPAAWKERFYITVSSLDVKRNNFITTHFVETGVQERHIQMDKKTYKTDRHGQTGRQTNKKTGTAAAIESVGLN